MQHDELVERFRLSVGEYVQRSEENLEEYERIRTALARGEGLEIERSLEYASLIVHSMETGSERVIYGNVRNDGLLAGAPGRLLRRGALPRRRDGPAPGRRARVPGPPRRPEPDVPERRSS